MSKLKIGAFLTVIAMLLVAGGFGVISTQAKDSPRAVLSYSYERLPCEGFWSPTHDEKPVNKECELQKSVALGALGRSCSQKQFTQYYETLVKADEMSSSRVFMLADDLLLARIQTQLKEEDFEGAEHSLDLLIQEHSDDQVCVLRNLDDKGLGAYFAPIVEGHKLSAVTKAKFEAYRFIVEQCTHGTVSQARTDLARGYFRSGNNMERATALLEANLNPESFITVDSIESWAKSLGYEVGEVGLRLYGGDIRRFLCFRNSVATSVVELLAVVTSKEELRKATSHVESIGNYPQWTWMKEISLNEKWLSLTYEERLRVVGRIQEQWTSSSGFFASNPN